MQSILEAVPASPVELETLPCGVPMLKTAMPGYHTCTLVLRVEGGLSSEPAGAGGLAAVIEQTLEQGSENMAGEELADALELLGCSLGISAGRESWLISLSGLPERMASAVGLLEHVLLCPAFLPEDVETAVELAGQELNALEDYPRGLLGRVVQRRCFGEPLGRHRLGSRESLQSLMAEQARGHWRTCCTRRRISASLAGVWPGDEVQQSLDGLLSGLSEGMAPGLAPSAQFTAGYAHVSKELEQTQVGLSFPGVLYRDADHPVESVLLAVLSGGMSSRLFVEVREKQGLVYWVGAWHEQARTAGVISVGAATTPARVEQTLATILREIDRAGEDVSEQELERARVGLLADELTSGASPGRRAMQVLGDWVHHGRLVDPGERRTAIARVDAAAIRRYLEEHPRSALSIVTLGREALSSGTGLADSGRSI